jgi:hypothetical protein
MTQVFWWDDSAAGGGCKVPVSWKAFYRDGDQWIPVETTDAFAVAKINTTKCISRPFRRQRFAGDLDYQGMPPWEKRWKVR